MNQAAARSDGSGRWEIALDDLAALPDRMRSPDSATFNTSHPGGAGKAQANFAATLGDASNSKFVNPSAL